ncbi:MAG: Asp23/Gls24 family envelope stress response protein, partial [Clostridia bacterium]
MENMVKKCVDSHDELNVNTTRIYRSRAGVVVDVKITLASGVNIPLTVNALQKQIKQYITSCSGVDVQEVRVMVETNVNKQAAQEMPIQEVVVEKCASPEKAAEPAHESFAQRMFKHNETPEQYAAAFQGSTAVEVPQAAPEMNFPMPEEQATPMAEGTAQENDEQKTAEKEKE